MRHSLSNGHSGPGTVRDTGWKRVRPVAIVPLVFSSPSSWFIRAWSGAVLAVALFAALGGDAAATATPQPGENAAPTMSGTGEPGKPEQQGGEEPRGAIPGNILPGPPPDKSVKDRKPARDVLRGKVMDAARAARMPPELADAVATVESNYNVGAIGGVGEIGLMQVLPSTARMLGFDGTAGELANPDANIRYGVAYLSQAWRLAGGDVCTTVMKYRAGHGESRFSHRSVDYCVRVRALLTASGYKVTGEVPKATFGDPTGVRTAGKAGARVAGRRSRYNWRAADLRMKAITSKVSFNALVIAR